MSRINDFLKSEKSKFGKIYVDINYAIDNISPFLDSNILRQRKYTSKVSILKKYIELLEAAETELNKKGFLGKFSSDNSTDLLEVYKKDNLESLVQLEKCSKCACLNCSANCKFSSCLGCKSNSSIVQCDHKKINITKVDNLTLNLTNDKTGDEGTYLVLAILHDAELDKKYIIIQNTFTKEKFILYYYPGISEDSYGEISDPDEFDFIVSTFQSIEE